MRRSTLAAVLALSLPLAGCAPTPQAEAGDRRAVEVVERGFAQAPVPEEPSIAWAGAGRLELVTRGSGSCPDVPETSTVAEGRLTLHLREYDGMCTMDLRPYRVVLVAPDGLDSARTTTVRLDRRAGEDPVLRLAAR